MRYLPFHYVPEKDSLKVCKKLLELRDCRIYVSRNMFITFLEYVNDFSDYCYDYTTILKFPKMNKIIFESNRVRDGIFYEGLIYNENEHVINAFLQR